MRKQSLILHKTKDGNYRTVIKTKHGRYIYLEITKLDDMIFIKKCYYIDREKNGEYYSSPKKLTSLAFNEREILSIVASQLDRSYFGVEYTDAFDELTTEDFIAAKFKELKSVHRFLILVGDGSIVNGLPEILTTRLANRIHRRIYMRITYYKDNIGTVEAFYYDRAYKARSRVTPQMLTSVFVEYNKKAIIDMVNSELNCDFTDIIIADNSINIEDNKAALCGNI